MVSLTLNIDSYQIVGGCKLLDSLKINKTDRGNNGQGLQSINYSSSQSLCSIYMIVYATNKSVKWQSDKFTHDFILQCAKDPSVHPYYLPLASSACQFPAFPLSVCNIEKPRMGRGTKLTVIRLIHEH